MINEFAKRVIETPTLNLRSKKINTTNVFGSLALVALVAFCVTQLAINAKLNPLGAKLEAFNQEKTLLIEENRQLEDDVAQSNSLTIINNIAQKKLDLNGETNHQIVYINEKDSTVIAGL